MKYYVETFTIKTGLFGVRKDKMDSVLAEKLNELAAQGFEIVSVTPVLNNSDNFDYQIVYKK